MTTMKKHSSSYTTYEVVVQEDGEDLLIPLPPHLLETLGWKEGDTIDITLDDQGKFVIKKVS